MSDHIKQYCNDLEQFGKEGIRGIQFMPAITVLIDNKGSCTIFALRQLTHEQKSQLLLDGFATLLEGVTKEEVEIMKARILQPHEYKKLD